MNDFAPSTAGPANGGLAERILEVMPSPTSIDLLAAGILDNEWVSPAVIRALFSAEMDAP
ncbi:hypothetical protein [Paraburkholderia domus]|uniref:Uncharacterized protein n=1 Tax=Paraburkholderia domus TaxID=2793075 RepID=A0A9N8R620_9BURK|nr:hypothetical protein [Paraburkholderia domus]MBK5053748.1 hypothetical protein [Burkholderia sp. R-70006]MBK5065602.1 hypothetical protein [Burkholderia sp. R-70199]MBK5122252.1 hypothetical protein [Burkholderia sp. R-69980]MBK5169783.1 hypothetical protein [Burkholderia sp. R-70211]MBK5185242.1 hypothetical protein [Burkholderia sp. R-69749]